MPKDPTPHGGEIMHELPDRARIPQPKPGSDSGQDTHGKPDAKLDMSQRPPLPQEAEVRAGDLVDDTGNAEGLGSDPDDTGKPSVTQQPAP